MAANTVNIAFQEELLREIDQVAKAESRSRSEFLREAARAYIDRKRRWAGIFELGRRVASERGISPEDVSREIGRHRRGK